MIDPLVGQTLGQYELQDRLGRGGMASVYRALQPSLGRAVAIKVLPLDQLRDPTLPERFRREARMAANLMHPNIVPVYDFGEWEGHLFIVMALIAGGTLKDRMQGPLPVESAVRLVGQVADGLGYAHAQGVVHRDVKPTNVLLAPGDWAMLGDFGIARALGETTRLTSPYSTIGTPVYMAPEQWVGGEVDGRTDLYSLGIVLYELLSGSPPFTATTAEGLMRQHLEMPVPALASRRPDLPPGFEDVVQIALAKEPDRRYRHAGELKAALEAAARLDQAPSMPTSTNLVSTGLSSPTHPFLGSTMRVADQLRTPEPAAQQRGQGGMPTAMLVAVLVLVVLLAGAVGYILAGGRSELRTSPSPTPTIDSAAVPIASTATPQLQQVAPTPLPPAPTTVPTIVSEAPTAAAPTATPPPPPTPPAPAPSTVTAVPPPATAPPRSAPAPKVATAAPDQRFTLIERHVNDYVAALNAEDYARAQAVCCTPNWRSRYPLEEWRKNFAGVTGLRLTSPFRYTTVEPSRIVAEVDYSFVNSGGAHRDFTLRWTFVPVGDDWLADDAAAFPRR